MNVRMDASIVPFMVDSEPPEYDPAHEMKLGSLTVNTTQQIMAMVAAKAGHPVYNPVGNVALGRIIGTSHTHAKRLISGESVMSRDAFVRACKFLELPPEQIVELTLALDADGSEDEGLRAYMRSIAKKLRPGVVKGGASILLGAAAMLAHVEDAKASGNLVVSAHDAPRPGAVATSEEHVLSKVARAWRRLVERFAAPALRPRFA